MTTTTLDAQRRLVLAPQLPRLVVRRVWCRRRRVRVRALPVRWTSTRRSSCWPRCRRDLARLVLAAAARAGAGGRGAALLAIASYQGDLARADAVFWLKYFLSSQSAILWMSVLFFMSTVFYWLGFFGGKQSDAMELIGSRLAWAAVTMALIGSMVRWYESHLIGPDIGHIPVSNLYEVFVLFCWLTTTFYLYFESRYGTRTLGAFVMLVVSAAVGFLLWYTLVRDAHEIQPLVPALQSWWMKLHVPANFIGYGTFLAGGRWWPSHTSSSSRPRSAAGAARTDLAAGRGAVLRADRVPPARRCRGRRQLLGWSTPRSRR
jgi:hypothetical protein